VIRRATGLSATPRRCWQGERPGVLAVVASERLAEAQRAVHVSNLIRRADGVHVRFVTNGNGATLPGAREIEPSLEDAYLLTNMEAGRPRA
jgi:hypothetical protein